jgi:hypothetical protein
LLQALAIDLNGAAARCFQAPNELQESGFASPGRTGDIDKLSSGDAKSNVGKDIASLTVRFKNMLEFDHDIT